MMILRHRDTDLLETTLLAMIEWHINPGSLAPEPVFLTTTRCHRVESIPGGNERRRREGAHSGLWNQESSGISSSSERKLRKPRPGQGQMCRVWEEEVMSQPWGA